MPLVGDQDSDVFNPTIKLSRTLKPGPGDTITMTANRIPAIIKHGHQVPPAIHERSLTYVTCRKNVHLPKETRLNSLLLPHP